MAHAAKIWRQCPLGPLLLQKVITVELMEDQRPSKNGLILSGTLAFLINFAKRGYRYKNGKRCVDYNAATPPLFPPLLGL